MRNTVHKVPTGSYQISLPADIVEDPDKAVFSYWMPEKDVLLQLSSYSRYKGRQSTASERLSDRMSRERLVDIADTDISPVACPDVAAKAGTDNEGVHWVHCYAVWPDLTIYITLSWHGDALENKGGWAVKAVKTLKRLGLAR